MEQPKRREVPKLPAAPVTLAVGQVNDLNQRLSEMRHDIRNRLAVIVAVAEIIKLNPTRNLEKLSGILDEIPRILERISEFTGEFEKTLSISHSEQPDGHANGWKPANE
jgi:hypothetical protein